MSFNFFLVEIIIRTKLSTLKRLNIYYVIWNYNYKYTVLQQNGVFVLHHLKIQQYYPIKT